MAKRITRYPWDKWFKEKELRLKKGENYHCMTHSMSLQVRSAAAARGLRVGVYIENNAIVVFKKKEKK